MKVVKQVQSLPIINHDSNCFPQKKDKHGPLLGSTIRCIISGPSNSGKINVMISLLLDPNGLRYENVYVYSKSLYQEKYGLLENVFKNIDGIRYFPYNDSSEIMQPADASPNSIFIFDDVACDK